MEDVIPGLRQAIAEERARRKRLAEEYPERWTHAQTTGADMARKRGDWERALRRGHLDRERGLQGASDLEDVVVAEKDEGLTDPGDVRITQDDIERGRGAEDEVVSEAVDIRIAQAGVDPAAGEEDEFQARLDEVLAGLPEVLAESGDIRITRADVERWIRQAREEVGEELAALLLAKDWPGEDVTDEVEGDDE